MENENGAPSTASKQVGTPTIQLTPNNINVVESGVGTSTNLPPQVQKTVGSIEDLNLDDLKLTQNFSELAVFKKKITTVPVRKPNRQEFVRVHPDPNYSITTLVVERKNDRETYLVAKELRDFVGKDLKIQALFTAITRQGVVFLWPVTMPGPDGKHNQWPRSLLEAVKNAKISWVRVESNMDLGAYECILPEDNLSEPQWPEITFNELVKIAFREYFIDSIDHPVLKELRGKE